MSESIKEAELQIADMLGSGSFGRVYKGKWRNREVAIKFVLRAKRSEVENIDVLVELEHPHLASIFGLCENVSPPVHFRRSVDEDHFCIVMEYCGQRTLRDIISDKQSIQKNLFLMWTRQITAAMVYLHERKLLHRDLKPENILLPADDALKVCDFGTVREWKGATTSMTYCGTVRYMAPEVLQGSPYSDKADVWSFGVILWEMLVQQLPYEEQESPAIIFKIGKGELALPVLNIPENIDGISSLLKICLDREFHQRPSYKEIQSMLEGVEKQISLIDDDAWLRIKAEWRAKHAKGIECPIISSECENRSDTHDDSGYSDGCRGTSKKSKQLQRIDQTELCLKRFDEFCDCYWNKPQLLAIVRVKVDTTIYLRAIEVCGFVERRNVRPESISVQLRNVHTDTPSSLHIEEIENGVETMKITFLERCELEEQTPYELSVLTMMPDTSDRYCCFGEGETTIRIGDNRSVTFVFNENECDPQTVIGFCFTLPPH